jgi:hypothetical protein
MALWGIGTVAENAANNYQIPKYLHTVDRNRTQHNVFSDSRGWVQRHYKSAENSGISTRYYDEVLVDVTGLSTTGGYYASIGSTAHGLGLATPCAIFFEDPNRASNISVGSGGTNFVSAGTTAYVHLVFNELVYCGAGATVGILGFNTTGTLSTGIVGYAASLTPGATVANWSYQYVGNGSTTAPGPVLTTNFNGQITNRVAFAFTATAGIGTVLKINLGQAIVGVLTDIVDGTAVTKTLTTDLIRNIGGAGTCFSVQKDGSTPVGIGTTTLTVKA